MQRTSGQAGEKGLQRGGVATGRRIMRGGACQAIKIGPPGRGTTGITGPSKMLVERPKEKSVSQRLNIVGGKNLRYPVGQDARGSKSATIALLDRYGRLIASSPLHRRGYARWEDVEKLDISLDRLIEHYTLDLKSQNKSRKTVNWYVANLRAFEHWLKQHKRSTLLGDFGVDVVRQYTLYLQETHHKFKGHPYTPSREEPLSAYSVGGHVRTLRAFASWLEREEYLTDNILAKLKVPKAPRQEIKPLTNEEIAGLLSCLNSNSALGARNFSVIVLMLDCGLRLSEVANLKMENVDFAQGQVMVRGKGSRDRIVPMGSNAQKYLQRYIYHFRPEPLRPDEDNVFLTAGGKPVCDNALKLLFSRLKRKARIPRIHAHLLRHTFATLYLRNGGDLFSLQRILGHATLEMVKVYSHLADEDIAIRHRMFSPMDRFDVKARKVGASSRWRPKRRS